MEIVIRTDQIETIVHPAGTPSAAVVETAVSPTSVVEQAAAVGAMNAGPAPAPPAETGSPPVNVSAAEHLFAPQGATGLSAGAAPTGGAADDASP